MRMIFRVIPIMWRAVRPSLTADMPAVVNTFWLRKGYEGLTFFGHILTPTQQEADRFNAGESGDRMSAAMKNHEMIHLRCTAGRSVRRQLKHAAYLLNPFEMEAYGRMNDLSYLKRCESGAQEWRTYAKMSMEQRLQIYKNNHKHR